MHEDCFLMSKVTLLNDSTGMFSGKVPVFYADVYIHLIINNQRLITGVIQRSEK